MAGNLQQLENDPRFRQLPYHLQQLMRSRWVEATLSKDERYKQLPLALQTKLAMNIINAPPKFSTPEAQIFFDAEEKKRMENGGKLGFEGGLREFNTAMYQGSSIARLAARTLESIYKVVDPKITGGTPYVQGMLHMLWNKNDSQKAMEYYRSSYDEDIQTLSTLDLLHTTGGFVGSMAETLVLYQGFGTPTDPRGLAAVAESGVLKNSAKIASAFGKSARLGNWVAQTGLPNVIHSLVAGGSTQAFRDLLSLSMEESKDKPSFKKIATVAAKAYGTGALADLLFFAATAPFVATAKAVKNIVFTKKASAFLKDLQLTDDDFKSVMKSFMGGEHIPKEIVNRAKVISPESARKLIAFQNHFITLRHFDTIDPNSPSLKKVDAFRKGWDAEIDASGKWTLKHVYDPTIKYDFADSNAMMKFLDEPASDWLDALDKGRQVALKRATTNHQQMMKAIEGSTAGAIRDNYYVRQKVKSKLGQDDASLSTVQANLLRPVEGKLNDMDLVQAARLYLKRKGVPEWDTMKIGAGTKDPGGFDLFIVKPTDVSGSKAQLSFVGDFIEKVDYFGAKKLAMSKGAGPIAKNTGFDDFLVKKAKEAARDFSRSYYKLVGYSDSWATYSALKLGYDLKKTQQGYDLINKKTGEITNFKGFPEITRELLIQSNDFHAIHSSLKEEGVILATDVDPATGLTTYYAKRGLGGAITPEGKVQRFIEVDVSKGQTRANVIAKSTDLRQLLDEIGWEPKASSYLGPTVTVVSPDFSEVEYIRNVAVGNYQSMLRHLSSFKSSEKRVLKFISQGKEGTIYLDGATTAYEVIVPEIGYRKTFATPKEARVWMQRGFRVYDVLDQIADSKGYRIEPGTGGWYIWNENNQYFAKNFDGLKKILEEAPLPEWAPELLDTRPPVISALTPEVEEGMFRPEVFDPNKTPKVKPLVHVSHTWTPTDSWMDKAEIAGLEREVSTAFRANELGRRGTHVDDLRVTQLTNTIFQDPKKPGHIVDDDVMVRVFNYMDAYAADKGKVIAQYIDMGKPLQDWEINIANTASEFLSSGMEKFGIPRELRVLDYISHIRRMGKADLRKAFRGTTEEILKRTAAPKELFQFFKLARKDDIMLLAHETNALKVIQSYFAIGNRNLHMGASISKLRQWTKDVSLNPEATPVQKTAAWRMAAYVDDVMGINTPFEEQIRQGLIEMGQKVGLKDPDVMKSFYSTVYSMSYLVNMGWRPWSAVRNFFQIWTTLAPRFGNSNVARSLEYVMKHPKEVIDLMKSKGFILEQLPLHGSEMLNPKSKLAKLTYGALRMFKGAEDLSRAVAFGTAKIQWDDAVKVYSAAKEAGKNLDLVSRQFLDVSGVSMIGPTYKREILTHLRNNDWASAFDTYAQGVIEETMFSYQAGLGPTAYRGVVGRAFGVFGTYPVWYIQNIKRGLTQGSFGQRAGFAARFVGNGLSLFAGFSAMGINAKDFLPWVPMQFSGGPYYKFANRILQATGSDYQGRQARGELKREIPRLLLPVSQLNNLKDALEHLDSGNIIDAMGSLMSVPHFPDK